MSFVPQPSIDIKIREATIVFVTKILSTCFPKLYLSIEAPLNRSNFLSLN